MMVYLASPYSSPDPLIVRTRYLLAMQATAILINRGVFVYSPIVHCHELAARHSMPTDFGFWRDYNLDMIRRCDALYVLALPGWDKSIGVDGEITFARSFSLPVHFIDEEANLLPILNEAEEAHSDAND